MRPHWDLREQREPCRNNKTASPSIFCSTLQKGEERSRASPGPLFFSIIRTDANSLPLKRQAVCMIIAQMRFGRRAANNTGSAEGIVHSSGKDLFEVNELILVGSFNKAHAGHNNEIPAVSC